MDWGEDLLNKGCFNNVSFDCSSHGYEDCQAQSLFGRRKSSESCEVQEVQEERPRPSPNPAIAFRIGFSSSSGKSEQKKVTVKRTKPPRPPTKEEIARQEKNKNEAQARKYGISPKLNELENEELNEELKELKRRLVKKRRIAGGGRRQQPATSSSDESEVADKEDLNLSEEIKKLRSHAKKLMEKSVETINKKANQAINQSIKGYEEIKDAIKCLKSSKKRKNEDENNTLSNQLPTKRRKPESTEANDYVHVPIPNYHPPIPNRAEDQTFFREVLENLNYNFKKRLKENFEKEVKEWEVPLDIDTKEMELQQLKETIEGTTKQSKLLQIYKINLFSISKLFIQQKKLKYFLPNCS